MCAGARRYITGNRPRSEPSVLERADRGTDELSLRHSGFDSWLRAERPQKWRSVPLSALRHGGPTGLRDPSGSVFPPGSSPLVTSGSLHADYPLGSHISRKNCAKRSKSRLKNSTVIFGWKSGRFAAQKRRIEHFVRTQPADTERETES